MSGSRRRVVAATLIATVVAVLGACGTTGHSIDDVSINATCTFGVSYEERGYIGTYPQVPFELGERIGTATIPPCNDTGEEYDDPGEPVAAYRVRGLEPADAIAIRRGPDDEPRLVAAHTPHGVAPAVESYIAERDPNGSILVTPDRDLTDGDTVTVTIRGLDAGTGGIVGQCASVQGRYACATRPTGKVPPPDPGPAAPADTEPAGTPTTAGPEPLTVVRLTLPVHEVLRGDLALFDPDGTPVDDRQPPEEAACGGGDPLSCLVAVRGTVDGEHVVRYAPIRFVGPGAPAPPATD